MADEPNPPAAPPAPPATPLATPPATPPAAPPAGDPPATPAPKPGTLDSGGDPPADPDLGDGELKTFREWLAGGDANKLKTLERYKSKDAIAKGYWDLRSKVREPGEKNAKGAPALTLQDGASEADIAAFREANSIPAEAKDYPAAFREDYKATEADKAILGQFKEFAHQSNMLPSEAAKALTWYQDFAQLQRQQLDGRMAQRENETRAALQAEWGNDYKGNINAAVHLMNVTSGEDAATELLGLRLSDGTRLQDNKTFVKMMAQLGGDYFGGIQIVRGDIETTAKSLQEQIDEGMKLMDTDRAKYNSPEHQEKMSKLFAQKEKLAGRG